MATIRRRAAIVVRCCLLATPFFLEACARPPARPTLPVYSVDLQGGAAHCTASHPELRPGQQTSATMRVGNDGGWCAISVTRDGKPYGAGLLTTRAQHGTVFIHPVGDNTRIDYTPERGYAGPDSFVVELLPGDANDARRVTVTR